MTGHDLMEIVPPEDLASAVPPSTPPRRISMEDADSSFTRKRPRLDTGARDDNQQHRAMSATPAPSDASPARGTATPVKVTINVRSQPPSSPLQPASPTAMSNGLEVGGSTLESNSPVLDMEPEQTDMADEDDDHSSTGSPPVVAIDDEDSPAGEFDDSPNPRFINAANSQATVEAFFGSFPYIREKSNYLDSLRMIGHHLRTSPAIEGNVLPHMAEWFNALPRRPINWLTYILDYAAFWDEIAMIVHNLLARRLSLGDGILESGKSEEATIYRFLSSYIKICALLIQFDAEALARSESDAPYDHPIVCLKHLRNLSALLRQDSPPYTSLFQVLVKEYMIDVNTMVQTLVRDFLAGNPIPYLFKFADLAWEKPLLGNQRPVVAQYVAELVTFLGSRNIGGSPASLLQFSRKAFRLFKKYDQDLQVPGRIADGAQSKDLIVFCAMLLYWITTWDPELASTLVDEYLEFSEPGSPTMSSNDPEDQQRMLAFREDIEHRPLLICNAYKFKLLRKYAMKGRMELRVMSIGALDASLVDVWREYNLSSEGAQHPVLQYLADFLLQQKVVDYIISVDSHPQLISRSGNIVGFLVVTQRYSKRQTDAIWNTVANSPDPRVVTATLTMLRGIAGLMDIPELKYLMVKLFELPIESYSHDLLRFIRDITHPKLLELSHEWQAWEPKSRPSNLAVRLIQDTAPSRTCGRQTQSLHGEASNQLRALSHCIQAVERNRILQACIQDIADKTARATGSIHIIHMLCSNPPYDVAFLTVELELTRHLIQELCAFVQAENPLGQHTFQGPAMQYRLELLGSILSLAPESVPLDLCQELWDHLVGKHALGPAMRDAAWAKFTESARCRPRNAFVQKILADHVPHLEPIYFSSGAFEFIAQATIPYGKQTTTSADGVERLEIAGADLLWSLILTAPQGTIEDAAARLLASRYVDIARVPGVQFEEVEQAHVVLAEQCTDGLLSSYKVLRGIDRPEKTEDGDTDMVLLNTAPVSAKDHELRFSRTLLIEKILLQLIRTKQEFSGRTRRMDSKFDAGDIPIIRGDRVDIRFQPHGGTSSEWKSLCIGKENTLQELYDRFCQATGFAKLNIISGGRRLDVISEGRTKIGGIPLAPMLVHRIPTTEITQHTFDAAGNQSAFESTILKHFKELHACMDSDDYISETLFEFLSSFSPPDHISEAVASGSGSCDDLFPPRKVFQARYAALALQTKLKQQLSRGIVDDAFIANAIRLLSGALLNEAVIGASLDGRHDLQLAQVFVAVLLSFLKERPLQEVATQYFSNESRLVNRLMDILYKALNADPDHGLLVCQCYNTILEASLHSRAVWDAFCLRPDTVELHQKLLLTDPRIMLRGNIKQAIASVCGGDLPSTCPLNGAEVAAQYWTIVSAILPEAVRYPRQSAHLFQIAEEVFVRRDESSRDEDSLRSCLGTWSSILMEYKHEEFVGRDDIDHVVLGFTKLLLCSIPSLKSFKKPLNAAHVMEKIFSKYLFPPRSRISETSPASQPELPVLNGVTRKDLYNLVLTLVEDRNSYDMLLELVESLLTQEEPIVLGAYSIDRSNEIRSPTGYVGLINPRAICYMNSLLTQLFMNLNFRKFMLEMDVADASDSQLLLGETKRLFGTMQNSYLKAADPRDFAACVKGLNCEPIDINIQMDADEFYNLLFDQWEGQMLSQEAKQRFRSFYGGHTVTQIKSKECDHVSERVESFFVVQCDVQGKANLQESLQAFVEGDVMEGDNKYKCESCGGKFVDAVKRTCLKDVPDNLIFHLKRFDFDLVEMRRTKINDYFEFPSSIDVSPYKVDHLSDPTKPRQEDIFELVGVLVHQGNSENGHYYSFIRVRPAPKPTAWVEYNDRDVLDFDPNNIAYHTFGGTYDDFQRQQKNFSAYMLFYQRRSAILEDHEQYMPKAFLEPPKVPVPASLDEEISKTNNIFLREHCLLDPNHGKFIRQMLTTVRMVNHGSCSPADDHQEEGRTIRVVLEHLCHVASHMRELTQFDEIMTHLGKTLLVCPTCCAIGLKWIAEQDYALVGVFFKCPHPKVRAQVRKLLIECLYFLRGKDPATYGVDTSESDVESSPNPSGDGILKGVVRQFYRVAVMLGASARGWDDFWGTLIEITEMGHLETAVILESPMLEFCLRLFTMQADLLVRGEHQDIWNLAHKKKHIFNKMVELVYKLLLKVDLQMPPVQDAADRSEAQDRLTSKFPLTKEEFRRLFYWHDENKAYAPLDRMIEVFDPHKSDHFYPGEILKLLLANASHHTQHFLCITVCEGINGLSPPYSDSYVRAALHFCQSCPVQDSVEETINAVARSVHGVKEHGGAPHLEFFQALLTMTNDNMRPDFFYEKSLEKCRVWAPYLLLCEDDQVRKEAALLVERLFAFMADNTASWDLKKAKYAMIRRLLKTLVAKTRSEREQGSLRSFCLPLIETCGYLANALWKLSTDPDPSTFELRHNADGGLLQHYELEVEMQNRNWVVEDETVLSGAEAYDHSDYGSESDEGLELDA